jgi:hypothetical protein
MIPNERADPRVLAERWTQALTAHDLEAAVACSAPDYHDEDPARRGEFTQGTRRDGTPFEFVGANIFGVRDQQFVWGRIYTALVRDAGGIDAKIERIDQGLIRARQQRKARGPSGR